VAQPQLFTTIIETHEMMSLKLLLILAGVIDLASLVAITWQMPIWLTLVGQTLLSLVLVISISSSRRNSARIDLESGLLAPRYFELRLHKFFRLARQQGFATSLIVLDVDHLTKIKDEYGQAAGDAVLSHLGIIMREHLCNIGLVGRLSDDRVAVVLPNLGKQDTYTVAARLRQAIAAADVFSASTPDGIRMTVSMGIAELSAIYNHPKYWLRAAEAALKCAKSMGCSCFVAASHNQSEYADAMSNPIEKTLGIKQIYDAHMAGVGKLS
jgi:diguanylate cyclase